MNGITEPRGNHHGSTQPTACVREHVARCLCGRSSHEASLRQSVFTTQRTTIHPDRRDTILSTYWGRKWSGNTAVRSIARSHQLLHGDGPSRSQRLDVVDESHHCDQQLPSSGQPCRCRP